MSAATGFQECGAPGMSEALKGHDFSRAESAVTIAWALAPEGMSA
jgi:hypothetical protein